MTLTGVALASETKTQTATRASPTLPRIFTPPDHRPLLLNSPSQSPRVDVSIAVQRAPPDATAPPGGQVVTQEPGSGGLFTENLAGFSACARCEEVRAKGLNEWMDHLGECHPVPSLWPSSKVDRLVAGRDLHHPYTAVVDSHKKRRLNVTPRPLNSFMIFAQYVRRLTLYAFPDAPNVHISRRMGVLWRTLAPLDREAFSDEARRLQSLHALEFPNYKYRPRKRNRTGARDPPAEPLEQRSPPLPPPPPPPPPVPPDPSNDVEAPLYPIASLLPEKLTHRLPMNLTDMTNRLSASSPLMVQVPDHQTKPEPPSSLDVDTSSSPSLSHCCSDGRSINWACSIHQAALEGEEEAEDWTLDTQMLSCPPEAWTNAYERPVAAGINPSEERTRCHRESHLSGKPFAISSPPPYKRLLSPVDLSAHLMNRNLCHHRKLEDSQVSLTEPPFLTTTSKSPSVELAEPCYRDAIAEDTWSFPRRTAFSPTDASCMQQQLYATNLLTQQKHEEGEVTGTEVMRSLMASGLVEPGFDSLNAGGIFDFLDYAKFHQLASSLQCNTAQETDSRADAETPSDSREARQPASPPPPPPPPSSPPTRQTALPSIESWVRNTNFSP